MLSHGEHLRLSDKLLVSEDLLGREHFEAVSSPAPSCSLLLILT